MSKKQKKIEAEVNATELENQDRISEGVVAESTVDSKKTAKEQEKELKKREKEEKLAQKQKGDKSSKKKKKDKEKKGGLVKKTKETVSELKKVTWPSFGEVVKKTGVVVAFVLIAGVFLFALNYVLGGLVSLLINGTWA